MNAKSALKGRTRPATSLPLGANRKRAWFVGLLWGIMLSLLPLLDFVLRPPRSGLEGYSFDLVRNAPPALANGLASALFLLAIPAALAIRIFGITHRNIGYLLLLSMFIVLSIVSSLFGRAEMRNLLSVLLVVYALGISIILASLAREGELVFRGFLSGVSAGVRHCPSDCYH